VPVSDAHGAEAAGLEVLGAATEHARRLLGDRLVGAYAVGSLVHGGFAPDVSDVDGVAIVDRCDAGVAATVAEVVAATRAELAGGALAGLADRLSLFWGDWATFGAPADGARLPPIVRLDLLDDGVALHGGPVPDGLPRPTHDDLVRESAAFAAQWLERDGIPDAGTLLAQGRRRTSKMVLFPIRFLATACAGVSGSNEAAVAWYLAERRPYAPLAAAALRWRAEPMAEEAAARLLLADLPGLYAEALDTYINFGDVVRADVRARLAALRVALDI
jgi:hypothetical protein